ncbi:head maturation protease, ClpP-related [Clostridium formicaceticum]|uniref:ATP-dependent Clp protease proteolytic subunit n=1 Tax=Clostridium formicaceticum TaxID=1497 RepID=A0AAC9RKS3_9CLOT|nr:head maturation protease, ClpP-related [Clostridium formicaceticum]ARE87108.1 ATP-dependent Clp protease proteolytic subunit 2 [Clostridium formicaceticum]
MPENKKYWEFKNKSADEADLYLYIEVASWGGGYYAHSAKSFKRDLDALGDIKTLNIYINSPGGDVFEGNAIYNMLKRKAKNCQINVYIDGLAASIASVIAMAGNVFMPSNAMMMVHNAWCLTWGNAKELRDTANALEKIDTSIKQTYLNKAGDKLDEETLTDLLDNETWLTAQECLDYGLCDEIIGEKQVAAKFDNSIFKNYRNVPKIYKIDDENLKEPLNNLPDESLESPKQDIEAEKAKLLMELELI